MESNLDALEPRLREILDRIPPDPGVYLMKDKKGRIVYVGKAASLRARVRSYFTRSGDTRAFVDLLGRLLGDIDTVVTNNEKEALLLENNLIKQHQPRFNVKLVDDKNYLVLRLDPTARFPRLEVVRRLGQDQARYFGPYHSATSCREALRVVNRHFKLRTCTDHVLDSRTRPCLQYQIKRCDAPCVFPVPEAQYGDQVRDVSLFLEGRDQELLTRLRGRMRAASEVLEYERAAAVRDQLAALEKTLEEQRVVSGELRDQDVFGFHREGTAVEIAVLHVRQGKLLGRRTFSFSDQEFPDEEIISSFVSLYYDLGSYVPDEVLLHCSIEDAAVKAEWLRERRGVSGGSGGDGGAARKKSRVEVMAPQRGERMKLVELAMKNAAAAYHSRRDRGKDADEVLGKLRDRLNLGRLPRRIECFDISHLQGTQTVASMVVFLDGEPARSEYRRFKVKLAENDDFASMYEVLSRRLRRSLPPKEGDPSSVWALPDLLVIDGGKGQLGSALAALRDVGIDRRALDVVSLAKERELDEPAPAEPAPAPVTDAITDEESDGKRRRGKKAAAKARVPDRVFLPNVKDPIQLRANTAELYVLARIRDEAHRFAITFHKAERRRRTLRSSLAEIAGVGATRQKQLLRHFGSLRGVREATLEELAAAPSMSRGAAEAVYRFIHGDPEPPPPTVDAAAARERKGPAKPRKPRRPSNREDVAEDAAAEELAALTGAAVDTGTSSSDGNQGEPGERDDPSRS